MGVNRTVSFTLYYRIWGVLLRNVLKKKIKKSNSILNNKLLLCWWVAGGCTPLQWALKCDAAPFGVGWVNHHQYGPALRLG